MDGFEGFVPSGFWTSIITMNSSNDEKPLKLLALGECLNYIARQSRVITLTQLVVPVHTGASEHNMLQLVLALQDSCVNAWKASHRRRHGNNDAEAVELVVMERRKRLVTGRGTSSYPSHG